MAVAFGIAAIVFAVLAPFSVASCSKDDQNAAPYCFAAVIVFAIASVAYGWLVH